MYAPDCMGGLLFETYKPSGFGLLGFSNFAQSKARRQSLHTRLKMKGSLTLYATRRNMSSSIFDFFLKVRHVG